MEKRFLSSQWGWKNAAEKKAARDRIFQQVQQRTHAPFKKTIGWVRPLMLAASVLLVGLIWYYSRMQQDTTSIRPDPEIAGVVHPGTPSAMLTLEDGTRIRLDDHSQGVLSSNAYRTIKKEAGGQIRYEQGRKNDHSRPAMNRISVPLGGLFEVVLPDGSKVWMNSGSSLSYPSRFTDKQREVELSGEAYFEVAHDPGKSFLVQAGDNTIEVTGTRFNVSAYPDDPAVRTTLAEGGVVISRDKAQVVLRPGQQAVSYVDLDGLERRQVNPDVALAWKQGYFIFDDQDIESVMREVARWYNIEIDIERANPEKKILGGMFSRAKSLDELLAFLERLKVGEFERTGRRVRVML